MIAIDRLGEFNPQLFRELKSKISGRNVAIMVAVTVAVQVLVLFFQHTRVASYSLTENNYFCQEIRDYQCVRDAAKNVLINWPKWWANTSAMVSWLMFGLLFLAGIYLLASNFSQEEKRGTLDFIRLAPQQARTILIGKFVGVPILVYLGVALAVPLQLYAALLGEMAISHVVAWDILMVAAALLFYAVSVLAVLWMKVPAFALTGGMSYLVFLVVQNSFHWYPYETVGGRLPEYSGAGSGNSWYGMVVGDRLAYYLLFSVLCAVGTYCLYQMLCRRYHQPQAAVLSKVQSYAFSLLIHLFLLGFYFYRSFEITENEAKLSFHAPFNLINADFVNYHNNFADFLLIVVGLAWFFLLIPVLLPSRQSLVEWSRYRSLRLGWRLLLVEERSPAMLAVAVNVAIASLVWLVPISCRLQGMALGKLLIGAGLMTILAVLYSSIAHWISFWSVRNRPAWMAGAIFSLTALPVLGVSMMTAAVAMSAQDNPLFLMTPFLWISIQRVRILSAVLILVLLTAVSVWVNMQLRRSLQKFGRTESSQHLAT
jgi:ABC-type transport system involved in multi-copper enzyme maturation permease subunit